MEDENFYDNGTPVEKKPNKIKIVLCVIVLLLAIACGFFIGRKTIKTGEPEVIYVPGDTVRIVRDSLVPKYIIKPTDTLGILKKVIADGLYSELFPEKHDTTFLSKDDSTAIMLDWASVRHYDEELFKSDTLGVCNVGFDVQYNRAKNLNYTYVPMIKEVIVVEPRPAFEPFLGVGVTTLPSLVGQVGLFYKDFGGSLLYQYDTNQKKSVWGGTINYRF